jgi:hypothetical protein
MAATIPELMVRATAALELLAGTAEPLDDEQQYVRDLVTVWSARLLSVGADRADQVADPAADAAIDWLAAEAARITDPHRAVDWLSTLPQAALLAVGETSA